MSDNRPASKHATEGKTMEYVAVKEARSMPGVRLVLSAGFPGPWGQCVKKMLEQSILRTCP